MISLIKLCAIFSLLLLFKSCAPVFDNPKYIHDIAGDWEKTSKPKGYVFNIHIALKGAVLSGYYCAFLSDASKIDCPTNNFGGCPLFGICKKDTGYLNFVSCFSGDTGKALIFIQNGLLHWKTIYNPYYQNANAKWNGILKEATLRKYSDQKKQSTK